MPWHRRTTAEIFAHFGTSAAGLGGDEARRRLAAHGPNVIPDPPRRSWFSLIAAQLLDVPILVLLGAALIAGVLGDALDALIIIVIVLLNAAIGLAQERRAEIAMAALRAMTAVSAVALRDGHPLTVPAADLVPGDVVIVNAGGIVPADLRLIEAATLSTDEAALTGESFPVEKSVETLDQPDVPLAERRNLLHKGTFVTRGRAVGVVVATGMQTEFGRIAALLREVRAVQTPLQNRLAAFGQILALFVIVVCVIVFAAGVLRGEGWLPMLMTALSLAVAAIPEALPAVVTISLAFGARSMIARQVLIRRLPAVETLGSVTRICADKTGTLTASVLRATSFHCDGETRAAPGVAGPWRELLQALAVSHDVVAEAEGQLIGDPLETALVKAAREAGFGAGATAADLPRLGGIPFDAERRCMTTVHREPGGGCRSITKGAPEVVLARTTRVLRAQGAVAVDRGGLLEVARQLADAGLRVIAVGERQLPACPERLTPETLERDLTLLGLVGLIDPPRAEAPGAIADCRSAGIVPVMITGDHPLTALAIARELGIATDEREVISGPALEAMRLQELAQRAGELRVYARVTPEQKLKIVRALQHRGECVAMTGDGVNDAPALRQADIGVAMGVGGTEVARDASAMVLLDNNLASIVRAVREGRRIYDNLRRFIRYQLTTNSAEIWTLLLAPFLGLPVPLLPIQILWINLVTDGLPGLALAAEPAERDVMRRPPRPPRESVFARGLGLHVIWVGLLMAGLTLGAQAWFVHAGAARLRWQTVTFTMLCFVQLGHVLAVRSERESLFAQGLLSNRPLLGAVMLALLLQAAIVYLPVCNRIFHTEPLDGLEFALTVAGALLVLLLVEVEKWVGRNPR